MRGRLGALLGLAFALLAAPGTAHAAASEPELIAYDDRGLFTGTFVTQPGNPISRRLIASKSYYPEWSPGGTRLAVMHNEDDFGSDHSLHILDRAGALKQRIHVGKAAGPTWSPDAKEIAYGCVVPPSEDVHGICIVNLETEEIRTLWSDSDDTLFASDEPIRWSPAGGAIALTVDQKIECEDPHEGPAPPPRCGLVEVATVDPVSGQLRLRTQPPQTAGAPSYSPDGTKLAYYDRDLGVRVGPANGTGAATIVPIEHALFGDGYELSQTAWSPDGSEVLWSTETEDDSDTDKPDLYSVKADGTGPYTLRATSSWYEYDPHWGPSIPSCTVPGSPDPDELTGSEGGDVICGEAGDDTIDGRAGDDQITGGPGKDGITGGAGRDTIDAGPDDDTVAAVDGEVDKVTCGDGTDAVDADVDDTVEADCERVLRNHGDPVDPGGGDPTGPTGPTGPAGPPSGPGGPAGPPATPGRDTAAPVVGAAAARRVKAGRRLALSVTLSEAASVRVALLRQGKGRRVGGKCVAQRPANRKRPRCTRATEVRRLRFTGAAGKNAFAVATRRVKPGSYRLMITATDAAGNASGARALKLTLTRR